jgi:hypothetical protein
MTIVLGTAGKGIFLDKTSDIAQEKLKPFGVVTSDEELNRVRKDGIVTSTESVDKIYLPEFRYDFIIDSLGINSVHPYFYAIAGLAPLPVFEKDILEHIEVAQTIRHKNDTVLFDLFYCIHDRLSGRQQFSIQFLDKFIDHVDKQIITRSPGFYQQAISFLNAFPDRIRKDMLTHINGHNNSTYSSLMASIIPHLDYYRQSTEGVFSFVSDPEPYLFHQNEDGTFIRTGHMGIGSGFDRQPKIFFNSILDERDNGTYCENITLEEAILLGITTVHSANEEFPDSCSGYKLTVNIGKDIFHFPKASDLGLKDDPEEYTKHVLTTIDEHYKILE